MLHRRSIAKGSGPGVGALHDEGLDFHFRCALGFSTQTLAGMLDSLVRVSRRVAQSHYASILGTPRGPKPRTLEGVVPSSSIPAIASIREAITHSEGCHIRSRPSTTAEIDADPSTGKYAQLAAGLIPGRRD